MHFIPTDFTIKPHPDGDDRQLVVNIHGYAIDDRALVNAIVEGLDALIPRRLGDDRRPEGCE